MFISEHRTDNTICLSGHVTMYVRAFSPLTGKTSVGLLVMGHQSCISFLLACIYIDLLAIVSSNLNTSHLLLSNSLLVAMDVWQPTPLCQMEYVTFRLPSCDLGSVKSE